MTTPDVDTDHPPSFLELEKVLTLEEAEKITSLSRDTLQRQFPEWCVRLTARRVGMKLRHALQITKGAA